MHIPPNSHDVRRLLSWRVHNRKRHLVPGIPCHQLSVPSVRTIRISQIIHRLPKFSFQLLLRLLKFLLLHQRVTVLQIKEVINRMRPNREKLVLAKLLQRCIIHLRPPLLLANKSGVNKHRRWKISLLQNRPGEVIKALIIIIKSQNNRLLRDICTRGQMCI